MLTPAEYWRVPCALGETIAQPTQTFNIGDQLAGYAASPKAGHGITIAAYHPKE
jgi:hypothetical protein